MKQALLATLCAMLCATLAAGCSSLSCGADPQKLASLRSGMSYAEVSRLMGCSGRLVRGDGFAPGEYATVDWDGPDSLLFTRTHVIFLGDRLQSYMTDPRGGF